MDFFVTLIYQSMCWLNQHLPRGLVWILGLTSNDIIDDIHTILKWYHCPQARQQNSGHSSKSLAHTNKQTTCWWPVHQHHLASSTTCNWHSRLKENPPRKILSRTWLFRGFSPPFRSAAGQQNSTFYLIMIHMTPFHQLIAKKTPWRNHSGKVTSKKLMARGIQMIPDIFWGPGTVGILKPRFTI